jgi:hypothetical protein
METIKRTPKIGDTLRMIRKKGGSGNRSLDKAIVKLIRYRNGSNYWDVFVIKAKLYQNETFPWYIEDNSWTYEYIDLDWDE